MPQWNNWHMTFSPDIVRSFLSMWSDSELCSVMLNAVDRSTRQHPKPLAWDESTVLPQALVSCEWQAVAISLHSFMSYIEHKQMLPYSQRVVQNIDVHQSYLIFYPDISVLSAKTDKILCKKCYSISDLLTKKKHFEICCLHLYEPVNWTLRTLGNNCTKPT